MHRLLVHRDGPGAVVLGLVERHLGIEEHRGDVAQALVGHGHADACIRGDEVLLDLEGRLDGTEHASGELLGRGGVGDLRAQHGELGPAAADELVLRSQDRPQARRDGFHQLVADVGPVRVVDPLEPVEVDEHRRSPGRVAARGREAVGDPGLEHRAVGQAGESVVVGELVQLGLEALARAPLTGGHGGDDGNDHGEHQRH